MSALSKKLEHEAILLPPRSRARLAQRLIASLDEGEESDFDEAWRAEAENRARELANGKARGIPAAKVFKKARAMLR